MTSGSTPIPVYNQACLATDSTSTSPSFFLVGSSSPGSLEVNYVNSPDSTTVNRVAAQNDQFAWTPNAAKLCYIYPSATSANPALKIIQFGSGYDMVHQPVDTDDAMLVVGTYGSYSGASPAGYTIVFDKSSRGQIFSAAGNLLANATNYVPTVALGIPTVINMNGITLTPNAIPITMGSVAYILDKEANGTTAIYTLNPSASSTLARVYNIGDSLPFTNNMAAAALNNRLLTYSVNKTGANINTFDLTSRSWSGIGLIKASVSEDPNTKSSSVPLGAIIGGVVGGLLLVGFALFFIFRRFRPRQLIEKPAKGAAAELAPLSLDMSKFHDGDQGYIQQVQYVPYDQRHALQYVQGHTPYVQPPGQGQVRYDQGYFPYNPAYERPTSFIPPPPPPPVNNNNKNQDSNAYKTYQAIMEEAGGSPIASTTVHSASYVSPVSCQDNAVHQQGSPKSTHFKSQRTSVNKQGPQYDPVGHFSGSQARSPQSVSNPSHGQ
ncbi:hypothetical protein BGZ96_000960 [Linnemannia gamsii]|uniref:Transmembrane protein n=1 Tax=Linnemannia gamsii TaxID=64522 RepID=A0ABQ7JNB9_9FUNG|nr:hypothetical protein BGZ96_000960 [Linnemannia gamsii]